MSERPFDGCGGGAGSGAGGEGFDFSGLCDELRCHTSESVAAIREEAVREQRRWRLRELAATRVLDERGRIDDRLAGVDGVSIRDVKATVATARALEDLPAIAQVAAQGRLSDAQLTQVVKVADPASEHEWAARAPRWSPADLAQKARELRTPTIDDAHARRAARELRWWWNPDQGMLHLRGALADVDGATFEVVMKQIIEHKTPAKGQAWATFEHRAADALMDLVETYRARRLDETTTVPGAHLVVQVPLAGPATVAGIPLPDQMVEHLRASARIEPHLVDDTGTTIAIGRSESVFTPKQKRAILLRDAKCRVNGCDIRGPLDVHHLIPRSWGGTDSIDNGAAVCKGHGRHHEILVPHGPYILLGNPNQPDGLTLIHIDDLPTLAALATQQAAHDARAGPDAA